MIGFRLTRSVSLPDMHFGETEEREISTEKQSLLVELPSDVSQAQALGEVKKWSIPAVEVGPPVAPRPDVLKAHSFGEVNKLPIPADKVGPPVAPRPDDSKAVRFGGGEYLEILPEKPSPSKVTRADRLRGVILGKKGYVALFPGIPKEQVEEAPSEISRVLNSAERGEGGIPLGKYTSPNQRQSSAIRKEFFHGLQSIEELNEELIEVVVDVHPEPPIPKRRSGPLPEPIEEKWHSSYQNIPKADSLSNSSRRQSMDPTSSAKYCSGSNTLATQGGSLSHSQRFRMGPMGPSLLHYQGFSSRSHELLEGPAEWVLQKDHGHKNSNNGNLPGWNVDNHKLPCPEVDAPPAPKEPKWSEIQEKIKRKEKRHEFFRPCLLCCCPWRYAQPDIANATHSYRSLMDKIDDI